MTTSPSEKDETAWLVELRGNVPMWWSLDYNPEPDWTRDANRALRFARKDDADAYIAEIGWTEAFATEHMWPAHKAHDWFKFKGMKCCRSCGNVWNATSDTRSCKGPAKVGPRMTSPSEKAITEAMVLAGRKMANILFNIEQRADMDVDDFSVIKETREEWDRALAAPSVPAPGAGEALPDNLDYQIRQIIDAALDSASPEPWEVSQDATKRIMSIILSALSTVTPVGEGWQTARRLELWKVPAHELDDIELEQQFKYAAEKFDNRGEHGGSPGEFWAERLDEIDQERRRRASLISGSKP